MSYKKGDIYIASNPSGFALYRVVDIDTKTQTTKTFKPTEKLLTSEV